jgi:hypothetical protein
MRALAEKLQIKSEKVLSEIESSQNADLISSITDCLKTLLNC